MDKEKMFEYFRELGLSEEEAQEKVSVFIEAEEVDVDTVSEEVEGAEKNVGLELEEWRNRIVGYGEVDPKTLLDNPKNWRLHPDIQKRLLGDMLGSVGWVDDITVNKSTGFVLDGHLRVAMAVERGEKTIPVKYVDLSEKEEDLALAMFDPIGALARADAEKLNALIGGASDLATVEMDRFLRDIVEESGGIGRIPTLEELEEEYGEPDPKDFWPVIRLQVSPEVFAKWELILEKLPGEDEKEKFLKLLSVVEEVLKS